MKMIQNWLLNGLLDFRYYLGSTIGTTQSIAIHIETSWIVFFSNNFVNHFNLNYFKSRKAKLSKEKFRPRKNFIEWNTSFENCFFFSQLSKQPKPSSIFSNNLSLTCFSNFLSFGNLYSTHKGFYEIKLSKFSKIQVNNIRRHVESPVNNLKISSFQSHYRKRTV